MMRRLLNVTQNFLEESADFYKVALIHKGKADISRVSKANMQPGYFMSRSQEEIAWPSSSIILSNQLFPSSEF
jgi:hypothetical protein